MYQIFASRDNSTKSGVVINECDPITKTRDSFDFDWTMEIRMNKTKRCLALEDEEWNGSAFILPAIQGSQIGSGLVFEIEF